jgi:hypothetical protein
MLGDLSGEWTKRRITALISKCPANILANAWTCGSVLGLRIGLSSMHCNIPAASLEHLASPFLSWPNGGREESGRNREGAACNATGLRP